MTDIKKPEQAWKDKASKAWIYDDTVDPSAAFHWGYNKAISDFKSSLQREIEKEIKNTEVLEPYYIAGMKRVLKILNTVEP
jgi:hypothetical protein